MEQKDMSWAQKSIEMDRNGSKWLEMEVLGGGHRPLPSHAVVALQRSAILHRFCLHVLHNSENLFSTRPFPQVLLHLPEETGPVRQWRWTTFNALCLLKTGLKLLKNFLKLRNFSLKLHCFSYFTGSPHFFQPLILVNWPSGMGMKSANWWKWCRFVDSALKKKQLN